MRFPSHLIQLTEEQQTAVRVAAKHPNGSWCEEESDKDDLSPNI